MNKQTIVIENSTLMYFDKPTGNGHIYKYDLVSDAIEEFKKVINNGNALGTLEHPDSMETSLTKISHRVTEIHYNQFDNCLDGTVEILDKTPNGQKLKELYDSKIPVVFRPRATGNVDENGIVTNYKIMSFDAIPEEDDAFKTKTLKHE